MSGAADVDAALARLERDRVVPRIWDRDHTVWRDDPREIADRLGWLDTHERMRGRVAAFEALAAWARDDGLRRAVLCGMGGSSLATEVMARSLPVPADAFSLEVLDGTHPADVAAVTEANPAEETLVVVSSKSGTTIETLSQLEHLWARSPDGGRFVAVTDPGTPLEATARERGFRDVIAGDPDIGGRYSALSPFGLFPAAVLAADLAALLEGAAGMAAACGPEARVVENPAARLGALLAASAARGRDKLTLLLGRPFDGLGAWIEQLVAESTGKDGTGIVPVDGEPLGPPEVYRDDRLFVALGDLNPDVERGLATLEAAGQPVERLASTADPAAALGAEFFRWELAVAVAGALMRIQPFDQPNVQEAKDATAAALEGAVEEPPGVPAEVTESLGDGGYLAILAFVPRTSETARRLERARGRLRDRLRVATTVGFGPRYLHSTGQLHKGGPATGAFLQVVDEPADDLPIPGRDYTFGRLMRAQALGDLRALRRRGRPAARLSLDDLERL